MEFCHFIVLFHQRNSINCEQLISLCAVYTSSNFCLLNVEFVIICNGLHLFIQFDTAPFFLSLNNFTWHYFFSSSLMFVCVVCYCIGCVQWTLQAKHLKGFLLILEMRILLQSPLAPSTVGKLLECYWRIFIVFNFISIC